jgi:hypothetical protein
VRALVLSVHSLSAPSLTTLNAILNLFAAMRMTGASGCVRCVCCFSYDASMRPRMSSRYNETQST